MLVLRLRLRSQTGPPPLYASAHRGPRRGACYIACDSLPLVSPKRVYPELKYLNNLDSSVCAAADTGPKAKGTVIDLLSANMKSARQQLNFTGRLSTHHCCLAPFQEPTMELPQKRREPERRASVVRLIHDYMSQDEQS